MGKIRVNGNALHAVFGHNLLNLAHRRHFLVRVNAPEAHKLVGIGPAEFKHAAVIGRETVGRFAVAACDDAKVYAKPVKIGHNILKRLGLALVKANSLAGSLEHGAVLDAVDDLRRIGTKTKINGIHCAVLLNWLQSSTTQVRYLPPTRQRGTSGI